MFLAPRVGLAGARTLLVQGGGLAALDAEALLAALGFALGGRGGLVDGIARPFLLAAPQEVLQAHVVELAGARTLLVAGGGLATADAEALLAALGVALVCRLGGFAASRACPLALTAA